MTIRFQIYNKSFYSMAVGTYYDPNNDNVPFVIVLPSAYKPREEVQGFNPIAPGQHPMPKEHIINQINNITFMFEKRMGMYQAENKARYKAFLAKQTNGYSIVIDQYIKLENIQGSISLLDLKRKLEGYSDETLLKTSVPIIEQNEREVRNIYNNVERYKLPIETINDNIQFPEFISLTKYGPKLGLSDLYPYIKNSPLPENTLERNRIPGTEDALIVKISNQETIKALSKDEIYRKVLELYDELPKEEKLKDNTTIRNNLLQQLQNE